MKRRKRKNKKLKRPRRQLRLESLESRMLMAVAPWTIDLGGPNSGTGGVDLFSDNIGSVLQGEFQTGGPGMGGTISTSNVAGQNNLPPNASDDTPDSGNAPQVHANDGATDITATVLANDSDPDGNSVAISGASNLSGTQGQVTFDSSSGQLLYDPNGAFAAVPDGATATDTFSYSITDRNGGSDTATVTVEVTGANDTPTIQGAATVSVDEGNTATNTGTLVDPDTGDSVQLTASAGTVIDNGDGTWDWSLDTSDGPEDGQLVTLTATDSLRAASTFQFQVNVNNVAAEIDAANPNVIVDEGQQAVNSGTFHDPGDDSVDLSASIGTVVKNEDGTWDWSFDTADGPAQSQQVTITATDSDGAQSSTSFSLTVNNLPPTITVDDTTLGVDEGQTAVNSGTFADVESDSVSLSATVGTVTDNGDGTWSWSLDTVDGPDQDQIVTIIAEDSDGDTATARFTLLVDNVAPSVVANDDIVTVNEGQLAINSGTFFDPGDDGLGLRASMGSLTAGNDPGTWIWTFDTADGPDQNDVVTLTAEDSDGASTTTTFGLVVKNVAPTITVENDMVEVDEGETATNSGLFFDPGDDGLSLRASIGNLSASGDPGVWLWSFHTADGPADDQTVTITAEDSDGAQSSVSFDLQVNNVAPVAAADISFDATGNVPIELPFSALLAGATDVPADTIRLTSIDAASENGGSITVEDAESGTFIYAPPAGFEGTDSFTFTIADDDEATATGTVTINVQDMIWFVDNSAVLPEGVTPDGTLIAPFQSLAPLNEYVTTGDADDAGDVIFVAQGDGQYDVSHSNGEGEHDHGFLVEDHQLIIGEAIPQVLDVGEDVSLATYINDNAGFTLADHSVALPEVNDDGEPTFLINSTGDVFDGTGTTGAHVAGFNVNMQGSGGFVGDNVTGFVIQFVVIVTTNEGGTNDNEAIHFTNPTGDFTIADIVIDSLGLTNTGTAIVIDGGNDANFGFGNLIANQTGGGLLSLSGSSNTSLNIDDSSSLNLTGGTSAGIVISDNPGNTNLNFGASLNIDTTGDNPGIQLSGNTGGGMVAFTNENTNVPSVVQENNVGFDAQTPVNDPPRFTIPTEITVLDGLTPKTFENFATDMTVGPDGETRLNESDELVTQTLTSLEVTGNSNPDMFADGPAIDLNGTLTFTPAADADGSATITVTLTDDGGTEDGGVNATSKTFDVHIPVNDAPTFTLGPDPAAVPEDAGPQQIAGFAQNMLAGPPDEAGQSLTFDVSTSNPALFAAGPAIDPQTGDLTFTPADDASGDATVTVHLRDDGGTANGGVDSSAAQTFDIVVDPPVNDPPTFSLAGNSVNADVNAGPQTLNNFATDISAGPADEAGQAVAFSIDINSNPGIFATQPAIDAGGTLTFEPAATGMATITVVATDDGGTDFGGNDTSQSQDFTITIAEANVAPELGAIGDQSVDENQPLEFTATANDPNGDGLLFSLEGTIPLGASIDPASGEFTWTPTFDQAGSFTFDVVVTDNGTPALNDKQTITIDVNDVVRPTVADVKFEIGHLDLSGETVFLSYFELDAAEPDATDSSVIDLRRVNDNDFTRPALEFGRQSVSYSYDSFAELLAAHNGLHQFGVDHDGDGNHESTFSINVQLDNFTPASFPEFPTVTGPSGTIDDTTPTITWDPIAGAASLYISANAVNGPEFEDLQELWFTQPELPGNATSVTTGELPTGQDLLAGVQANFLRNDLAEAGSGDGVANLSFFTNSIATSPFEISEPSGDGSDVLLDDGFNDGTGGVPNGWTIVDADGTAVEAGSTLTLTSGAGDEGVGLVSDASFDIHDRQVTFTASVLSMTDNPEFYFAFIDLESNAGAGIDFTSDGNIEFTTPDDPIGGEIVTGLQLAGYNSDQPVELSFTIEPAGIRITAVQGANELDSGLIPNDQLNGFSQAQLPATLQVVLYAGNTNAEVVVDNVTVESVDVEPTGSLISEGFDGESGGVPAGWNVPVGDPNDVVEQNSAVDITTDALLAVAPDQRINLQGQETTFTAHFNSLTGQSGVGLGFFTDINGDVNDAGVQAFYQAPNNLIDIDIWNAAGATPDFDLDLDVPDTYSGGPFDITLTVSPAGYQIELSGDVDFDSGLLSYPAGHSLVNLGTEAEAGVIINMESGTATASLTGVEITSEPATGDDGVTTVDVTFNLPKFFLGGDSAVPEAAFEFDVFDPRVQIGTTTAAVHGPNEIEIELERGWAHADYFEGEAYTYKSDGQTDDQFIDSLDGIYLVELDFDDDGTVDFGFEVDFDLSSINSTDSFLDSPQITSPTSGATLLQPEVTFSWVEDVNADFMSVFTEPEESRPYFAAADGTITTDPMPMGMDLTGIVAAGKTHDGIGTTSDGGVNVTFNTLSGTFVDFEIAEHTKLVTAADPVGFYGGGLRATGGVEYGFTGLAADAEGNFKAEYLAFRDSNSWDFAFGGRDQHSQAYDETGVVHEEFFQTWQVELKDDAGNNVDFTNAELSFHYDESLIGQPWDSFQNIEDNLQIFHYDGENWVAEDLLARDTWQNTITISATDFSPFVLGYDPDGDDSGLFDPAGKVAQVEMEVNRIQLSADEVIFGGYLEVNLRDGEVGEATAVELQRDGGTFEPLGGSMWNHSVDIEPAGGQSADDFIASLGGTYNFRVDYDGNGTVDEEFSIDFDFNGLDETTFLPTTIVSPTEGTFDNRVQTFEWELQDQADIIFAGAQVRTGEGIEGVEFFSRDLAETATHVETTPLPEDEEFFGFVGAAVELNERTSHTIASGFVDTALEFNSYNTVFFDIDEQAVFVTTGNLQGEFAGGTDSIGGVDFAFTGPAGDAFFIADYYVLDEAIWPSNFSAWKFVLGEEEAAAARDEVDFNLPHRRNLQAWEVEFVNEGNDVGFGHVDLTFAYDDLLIGVNGASNEQVEANLQIYQWNTDTWEAQQLVERDTENNTITVRATSASPMVLGFEMDPLLAAGGQGAGAAGITAEQLAPIVEAAISRFADAGLSDEQLTTLHNIDFQITDLSDGVLGAAFDNTILIDFNAAGHGWFVDPTPRDDAEFTSPQSQIANPQSMDALSVVFHEMGHVLGAEHSEAADHFMAEELSAGERRVPAAEDLDALFGNHDLLDEILDAA